MNPLTTCGDLYDQRISVCVRARPLNKKEINRKEISVTTIPTADKIMVGFCYHTCIPIVFEICCISFLWCNVYVIKFKLVTIYNV